MRIYSQNYSGNLATKENIMVASQLKPVHYWIRKLVQQGGSSFALQQCIKNRYLLNLFICDNSDLQVAQVKTRLLESGVKADDIIEKEQIYALDLKDPESFTKIIVINKHPTYSAKLHQILSVARTHYNGTDLYWDESDYDSPYYDIPDPTSQKDLLITSLADLCRHTYQITATKAGLALGNTVFNGGAIELDKPDETFLKFEDLIPIHTFKEYIEQFLKGEKLNDIVIEKFLTDYQDEGILIRIEHRIEGMQQIKQSLKDAGYNSRVLAGDEYVDPRTATGIIISYKKTLRGVTFPLMRHMVVSLPENPTFADVIQLLRILGWAKKLLTGNYILISEEDWKFLKKAHEAEKIYEDALLKFPEDVEGRHNFLREQDFPMGEHLSRNKTNGWKRLTKNKEFKEGFKLPYSDSQANLLIKEGVLAEILIDVEDQSPIKWGNRPLKNILSDMINQAPNSRVRLMRGDIQRVLNGKAIKRLYSKDELAQMNACFGCVYIDGEWYLQYWTKVDSVKTTRLYKNNP